RPRRGGRTGARPTVAGLGGGARVVVPTGMSRWLVGRPGLGLRRGLRGFPRPAGPHRGAEGARRPPGGVRRAPAPPPGGGGRGGRGGGGAGWGGARRWAWGDAGVRRPGVPAAARRWALVWGAGEAA